MTTYTKNGHPASVTFSTSVTFSHTGRQMFALAIAQGATWVTRIANSVREFNPSFCIARIRALATDEGDNPRMYAISFVL